MKGEENRLSLTCRIYLRFTRQLPACGPASQGDSRRAQEREGVGGHPESLVAGARWRETGSKVYSAGKRENRNGGGRVVRLREKLGSVRAISRDKGRRCNLLGLWYISIHRAFMYPRSPFRVRSPRFFHLHFSMPDILPDLFHPFLAFSLES